MGKSTISTGPLKQLWKIILVGGDWNHGIFLGNLWLIYG